MVAPGLTVVTGPMAAGKSAYALDTLRELYEEKREARALVFKPASDTRTPNLIWSRNGSGHPAIEVETANDIQRHVTPGTDLIVVDEGHLFDVTLPATLFYLRKKGFPILVAGLDLDFRTKPFLTMAILMESADNLVRVFGVCNCGVDSEYTQRLNGGQDRIVIGDSAYETRCGICYEPPMGVQFVREEVKNADY